MGGQTLARNHRSANKDFVNKYLEGSGIDVGGGGDSITKSKDIFTNMVEVRNWEKKDGDGMLLEGVADNTYDFLHSSHSLEHMVDVDISLKNWIRVVKPGGYLVIIVPDFDMYERGVWPSKYNSDHKWAFTYKDSKVSHIICVPELIKNLAGVELEMLNVLGEGFIEGSGADQTSDGTCQCGIEFVLRKL
jgi:SAM-dependent methyltransferase